MIEAYCTSAKTRQTLNSSKLSRQCASHTVTCTRRARGQVRTSCLRRRRTGRPLLLFLTPMLFCTDLSNKVFSFTVSSSPLFTFSAFLFHFKLLFCSNLLCFCPRLICFLHNALRFDPLHVLGCALPSHPHCLFVYGFPIFVCALNPSARLHLLHHRSSPSLTPKHPRRAAWQGTDLMHNHVLADVDRSCLDSPGRRSSVSRPELSSDLSEDSDYDSIWTSHSYRMGSVPRKSCISHQN